MTLLNSLLDPGHEDLIFASMAISQSSDEAAHLRSFVTGFAARIYTTWKQMKAHATNQVTIPTK